MRSFFDFSQNFCSFAVHRQRQQQPHAQNRTIGQTRGVVREIQHPRIPHMLACTALTHSVIVSRVLAEEAVDGGGVAAGAALAGGAAAATTTAARPAAAAPTATEAATTTAAAAAAASAAASAAATASASETAAATTAAAATAHLDCRWRERVGASLLLTARCAAVQ